MFKRSNLRFLAFLLGLGLTLPSYAQSPVLPDLKLTPGKTNPALTKDVICAPTFRTGMYRKVTIQERAKVFEEYGIDYSQHLHYEVDHLISLELGGSNDVENLWPEPYLPVPGAHEKDKLENALHREVCLDQISLEEAQKEIVNDWYAVYQRMTK